MSLHGSRKGALLAVCVLLLAAGWAFAEQTLVVYSNDPATEPIFKQILDVFAAANGCQIKLQSYPEDEYMQVVTAAFNAGSQIDFIYANGQDVRFMAQKGIIKDLTDHVTYLDRFHPAMLVPFTFSKRVYGLPVNTLQTSAVYYNKEIYSKLGIARLPVTYDELVSVSATIRKNGIAPIAMGGGSIYMWPMWFFQTFAQTSKNKSFERTVDTLLGKARFTDPDYVDAMSVLARFGKDNLFISGVNGTSQDSARSMFISGKAAMFYGGTWEIKGWYESGMNAEKIGVMPFPLVAKGVIPESTGGPGSAYVIYSKIDPSRLNLAYKLLDFLTSDPQNELFNIQVNATNSVNRNVHLKVDDPLKKTLAEDFVPRTTTFLDWVWPPEITKAFQQQIQAVIGQQITPVKAMQAIQKTYDEIVKKGYKFYN